MAPRRRGARRAHATIAYVGASSVSGRHDNRFRSDNFLTRKSKEPRAGERPKIAVSPASGDLDAIPRARGRDDAEGLNSCTFLRISSRRTRPERARGSSSNELPLEAGRRGPSRLCSYGHAAVLWPCQNLGNAPRRRLATCVPLSPRVVEGAARRSLYEPSLRRGRRALRGRAPDPPRPP